jgi:hypothetical protein
MIRAFLLILLSAGLLFADLFPADIGNQWSFLYYQYSSNFGSMNTMSGNVFLKVIDTSNQTIKIEKKLEYLKRFSPTDMVDTTYQPPIISFDTMSFIYKSGVLVNTIDTNLILIHSLNIPLNSVTVSDTQTIYDNETLHGYKIQRAITNGNPTCIRPHYFILVDSIGPVSYTNTNSSCEFDFGFLEKWTLTGFSKSTSARYLRNEKPIHNKNITVTHGSILRIPDQFGLSACKVELLHLNGKRIWQKQIQGTSHLTIPSSFLNVGTCLVRLTSSGIVLTEQVFLVR